MEQEDAEHQIALAKQLKRRLHHLQKKAAVLGLGADPSIIMEIEDLDQKISSIYSRIRTKGFDVDILLLSSLLDKQTNSDRDQQRILVIDDHVVITNLVRMYLQETPYLLLTANDGIRGLRLATTETPDIVLLDISMPDYSGLHVLEKIRERKIPTRVIMLTADSQVGSIVHCIKQGACEYITKPFSQKTLLACVERCLEIEQTIDISTGNAHDIIDYLTTQIQKLKYMVVELIEEIETVEERAQDKSPSSKARIYQEILNKL